MLLKFKDLWKKIIIIIMVLLISTSTFAKPTKTDAFALELWMLGVMATMLVGGGIVFTQEPTQEFLTDTFYSLSTEVQQGIANAQSLGTAFYMVGINEYRKFMDDIYTLFGLSQLSNGDNILNLGALTSPTFNIVSTANTNFGHGLFGGQILYNGIPTYISYYNDAALRKYTQQVVATTTRQNIQGRRQSPINAGNWEAITMAKPILNNGYTQYGEFLQQFIMVESSAFGLSISDRVLAIFTTQYGLEWTVTPNYNDGYITPVKRRDNQQHVTESMLIASGILMSTLGDSIMKLELALPMPKTWEDLDDNEKDEALKDGFANHNGKLILGGAAAAVGSMIGTLTPPLVRDVPKDGSWLEDLTDEDINNIGLAGVIAAFAQLINSLVKKITDTFDKPSPSPSNIDLLKTTIMMKVPCMTEFTGAFEQIMELQGETPVHTFTLFGKQYSFEYYKLFEGFIHVSSYIKQFFNFILWFLFLRGGIRRITSTLSGGTTEGNDQ